MSTQPGGSPDTGPTPPSATTPADASDVPKILPSAPPPAARALAGQAGPQARSGFAAFFANLGCLFARAFAAVGRFFWRLPGVIGRFLWRFVVPDERGRPFAPHIIIFFSSACVMVVELVAGRLIARHLGSSLYTWTTIIGVVLAGMCVGNWIGGRIADRWRPKAVLGWLFMIASAMCVLGLVTNYFFAEFPRRTKGLADWLEAHLHLHFTGEGSWVTRIVTAVITIFLPPALALGTISPVVAKLALDRSKKVGTTIGSVYAWGAAGSILGTFATGFYLIAALGATGVVLTTALALAAIGLLLGPARWIHWTWVLLLAAALYTAKGDISWLRSAASGDGKVSSFARYCLDKSECLAYELHLREGWENPGSDKSVPWEPYCFAKDSNYQFVEVDGYWNEETETTVRQLRLDCLTHGYADQDDPLNLHYEYELLYRDIAVRYWGDIPNARVDTFFLGGGAYAFQRWVLAEWPGSTVEVAEIDPMVLEANYEETGLDRNTPIKTYIGDARNTVDDLPADKKYDFVFGDAFSDLSVPFHLTTVEFTRKVASHLKPEGAYIVNVIDDWKYGHFLARYVLTLQKVFRHVYVFCTEEYGVGNGRDTFVLAASNVELNVHGTEPLVRVAATKGAETKAAAADSLPTEESMIQGMDSEGPTIATELQETPYRFPGARLMPPDMEALRKKCDGQILTDDDAPVENLLAPVVRARHD